MNQTSSQSSEPAQEVANRPHQYDHARVDAGTGFMERTHIDWRIWLGIIVTGSWLLILTLYISSAVGWLNLGRVPIDTLGSFLEGSFAPLAFLWFVLAYFSQQKELAQNTEALRLQSLEMQRSVEQATVQAEAISHTELHARREAFSSIHNIVRIQLGNILGFLFISSQGASVSGSVSDETISKLWNNPNPEAFAGQLLELSYLRGEIYGYKLFWGTEVRTKHSNNFMFNYERLLATASECDHNGMIRDAVDGTTNGYVYNRMLQLKDNPPNGFTFGQFDFDPDTDS